MSPAKTIADAILAGTSQTVVANPTSDADANTALAQFETWAAGGKLTYTKDGSSQDVVYPSLTITSFDSSIKVELVRELQKYNKDLDLQGAKTIADKVLYDNEPQTVEANAGSPTVANTVLAQLEVWAQEGKLVYSVNGDIPQVGGLDPLFIIKTIKFSSDSVPADAKVMATGLYYTLDETTGALVFYASDSKTISAPAKSSNLFKDLTSLTSIDFTNFSTSNATEMDGMFYNCRSLESLDLSTFDTSNVTDMAYLFYGCKTLKTLNISTLNTSLVTDMKSMFDSCMSLTTLNVSSFNTSNVTNMSWMFSDCMSLTTLDLRNFNTEKVTTMKYMFWNCVGLKTLNVSSFDTSNVTDIEAIFRGLRLSKIDLSNFNLSKVENMTDALPTGSNISADLSNVDLSNSTVCVAVAGFVTGNTFEDLNLTGCDLEQLSEAMEEGSSIDTKSITFDTDKIGRADIALTNPLYNNGVEYNTIDSSISGTATGTVKLTNTKGDVPSTGVVTESILPAIITLALLMSLSVAGLALKKKKNK